MWLTDRANYHPMAPAILMRNVTKSYDINKTVINGLNMTVSEGSIYALVGCSGCGKSTLLSTVLGLEKTDSGHVSVFGKNINASRGDPLGYSVGYMPQDYSLYNELTIEETLTFFGMLPGLHSIEIKTAISFYSKILQLPKKNRRVDEFSGGQKRRLSLAIALMHKPKLLLLDEPTVGMDPLLRENIWDYLRSLTAERGTTILVTTHYIDETRRADRVGLLKGGRLISEASPKELLAKNNLKSIEEAIISLWKNHRKNVNEANSGGTDLTPFKVYHRSKSFAEDTKRSSNTTDRVKALVWKNWLSVIRSFPLLLVMLIVPSTTMFTMFIANGTDPKSLNFGVVNEELGNFSGTIERQDSLAICTDLRQELQQTCSLDYLSCRFVGKINREFFKLIPFSSTIAAKFAVRNGNIRGFIHFPGGFSWEFYERAVTGLQVNLEEFHKSDIILQMDQSNAILTQLVKREMLSTYEKFVKDLLTDCGYNANAATLLTFKDPPLLGISDATFRDYIVPGAYIALMFYWPIVSSGIYLVHEKRTSTLRRSLVYGVKLWELFVSFAVTETFIAFARMLIMYWMAIYFFQMELVGSLALQVILGFLSSYMGVSAGFLLGTFCSQEIQVAILSIAIFCPNIVLSGICWPVEGMPELLKPVSSVLPCTLAAEAMRSIVARGWGFSHPNVWPGFLTIIAYTSVFFISTCILAKLKALK